jgi:hypothetical protein
MIRLMLRRLDRQHKKLLLKASCDSANAGFALAA